MSKKFVLRCRAQNGQHILNDITENTPVGDVKAKISAATGISTESLKILSGYPPKVLCMTDNTKPINSLVASGDTLTIERSTSVVNITKTCDSSLIHQLGRAAGILTRKVVPADNSCLFTSIATVLINGKHDINASSELRKIIVDTVSSDKARFTEAFLGKSNRDYCAWIQKGDTWGGAIEISILSDFYHVEIDVVDTQSGRIDRFGEDKLYDERVFIIYDGIHYDPLVFDPCDDSGSLRTMFHVSNEAIMTQAIELAEEAKASRQFTDLAGFDLKCLVCSMPLKGQREAQQHAQKTGHVKFGEMLPT